MTQSSTWDTLQIARDARLCGLTSQYEALLAETAPDFEYVRMSGRRRVLPFEMDDGDRYDDDDEPESYSDQRRNWADAQRWAFSPSMLEWPKPLNLTSFDAMLREYYSPERVSQMARATVGFLERLRPARDPDAIEVRLASYANLVVPAWNAIIKVD
jgi:hypothetical protein